MKAMIKNEYTPSLTYKTLVACLSLLLVLIVAPIAKGQSTITGGVAGVITDQSGAVVTGASITLKNSANGEEYKTVTKGDGSYSISLVKPGQYTITIEKPGFSKVTQSFSVGIGQVATASYSMKVGLTTETVEVHAAMPLLQTENANIATTYDASQVEKLPNPGNDLTSVAQTAPGVLMNTSNGGGYGNFNAFGLPATSNLFTVNGNDEMDPYLNLNNSGATNLLLGTNEVQEVAVVSNGYTGQYGRQAGAQIDYATKSGSNKFHGNAIYWWNGRALNANDWFTNQSSTPRPFVNNNQWAASLGGPIKKDKAFFFVDTEGLRYILASSAQTIVPTTTFANAVLANLPANISAASLPFYQNIFNLYANAPGINRAVPVTDAVDGTGNLGCGDMNTTGGSGGVVPGFAAFGGASGSNNNTYGTNLGGGIPCAQVFRSTVGQLSKEWILAGKVDFNINDNNRINIRYRMDHGVQPTYTDPISPVFNATSIQPAHEGQINYSRNFSANLFNQLIVSGSWYSAIFGPESNAAQSKFPGALYDFDTSGWANIGGVNNVFPQGRNVTQYQVVDDLSWSRGAHTFKFGGNYRRNDISDYSNLVRTVPRLRVFSRTDFATGLLDQISQRFPSRGGNPVAVYSFGLYAQDEWRATKSLKLTLALRGDRNSNPVCQTNCIARFVSPFGSLNHDPTIPFNQMITSGLHSGFPNIEKVVFQPRVGFTWQPGWAHNTVVRGGMGLFSDLYPANLIDSFMHNAPQLDQFTLTIFAPFSPAEPGNVYTAEKASQAAFQSTFASGGNRAAYCAIMTGNGLPCRLPDYNSIANNVVNPKFLEWNTEIQHTFGSKTVLSLNYVGNMGYDLFVSNAFMNTRAPSFVGLPTTATDLRVANVTETTNAGESNYHGLTASVSHRFTAGFSGRFNYTWSHSLDDVSNGGLAPYSLNDSLLGQLNPTTLGMGRNYSNSDYDVRHVISANYVWDLPFKSTNAVLGQMVNGWTMAGTIFHRTGLPFSVIDGAAPGNLLGNGVNAVILADLPAGSPRTCSPSAAITPCFPNFPQASQETGFGAIPRNSYRGPGYFNTDFSVIKKFRITEGVSFHVGANFYNVLNHPNFANPTSDISSGQFGQILSTVVPPTSPYGSFTGSAVSGRLVQLTSKITF